MKVAEVRAMGVRGVMLCVVAVLACAALFPWSALAVPADAARATYDDAGRLRSFTATDVAGGARAPREASVFSWDPVGNLLSVDRYLASDLSVIGMTPERGKVGDTIAINGTGFGSDPRALAVRFAGTAATIVSASDEQLEVVVPTGAASGTVTVTLGASSATGAEPFMVESDQAPTISSATPAIVRAGDQVTLGGTHFSAAKGENDVRVNQARALVTSARATEIVAEAPPTGSGHVSVETPDGVAIGPDVFVVPSAYATANVQDTARLTLGSGRAVSLSASAKLAMYVVDLRANDRIRTQLTSSTMSGAVSVWSPTGTKLTEQGFSSGSSLTSPLQVTADGTYAILVSASSAGGVTLTPFVDVVDTIVPTATGATRTIRTSFAGQDARLRISGRAGQRIAVAITSNTLSGWVEVAPAGTRNWINPYSSLGATAWNDIVTLPSDGSYDVWLETTQSGGGQATVTVYDVPAETPEDITVSSTLVRRDLRFEYPGWNAVLRFSGRAGERVMVRFPTIGLSDFKAWLLNASGTAVASSSWTSSSRGFMEGELPADGTYRVVVDPTAANTGTATVEIADSSDVVETITPSASGTSRTLTTTYPGQDVRLRFDARAGQRFAVAVASSTLTGWIQLARAGTRSYLPNWVTLSGSSGWLDLNTIATDGSYDAWLETSGSGGGSATVTVYDVPADQREDIALSTDIVTRTIRFDSPGQNAQFSFTGRAGQRATVRFPTISLAAFTARVVDARGSTVASSSWTSSTRTPMEAVLPSDGTYTLVVDPTGANTGSVTMEVGDASDVVQSITPSASGTTTTVRTSFTGQDVRLRFAARAGQRIAVGVSSNTLTGYIELARAGTPNYLPNWVTLSGSSGWLDINTISADGDYDVWLETSQSGGGQATVTVYDVPAETPEDITVSSTLVSRDLTFTYPGWNAVERFSGRAGERVMVRFPRIGLSSFKAWLLNASGTAVTSSNWTSTTRGFMEGVLPADGTYRVVVDPTADATGSATVEIADSSDVVETITPSASGVSRTLTASYPGQDLRLRFDARAGQRIAVGVSSNSLSGYIEVARAGTANYLPNWVSLSGSSGWLDINRISSDGSYDAWIESTGASGGSATVTVYDVPADQSETVTLSSTALRRDIRIDYPGQGAELVFSGTSGDTLATELTSSTLTSAALRYRKPDASTLLSTTFGTSGSRNQATLTSTGTHKIEIDPAGSVTGAVSLSATLTGSGGGGQGFRSGGPLVEKSGASGPSAPLPQLGAPSAGPVADTPAPPPPSATSAAPRRSDGQLPRARAVRRPRRPGQAAGRARRATRRAHRRHAHARHADARRPRAGASARRNHAGPQRRAAHRRAHRRAARPHRARRHAARRSAGQHLGRPQALSPAVRHQLMRTLRRWRSPAPAAWRPTREDRRGTWTADLAPSPWARLPPLQAPAATTALAGQVLRVDGTPLRDVRVAIEDTSASARTDSSGRFLLTGADAGRHVLVVDGRHVGGRRYGIYEIRVELAAGETTALPYTVWLTELDHAGDTRVDVPTRRETVLTNPAIPGLEVHLPAGSRITDADGRVVRDLNLTAIAVDRPPFPLPDGTNVPAYFTAQPGRAYLSKGARIIYPNYHHLPPHQRVAFWNYDADDRGWYVYGYGEVTDDARQVIPDPGVRIWEFTGAMATTSAPAPGSGPAAGGGAGGGDPVDLGTGLFVYRKTDLNLPDAIPATLQRIYRPADSNIYGLGRGTTTPYDLRLWNVTSYTVIQLILPDGGTIRFDRTSPGTDWQSGIFEQRTTPGPWFGALIRRMPNVDGWELHRRDGTVYEFGSGYGPVTAIQDPDGNRLTIDRSQGNTGLATRLTTQHGRWLRFTYNGSNLATSAVDNAGRRVSYSYDANQRLETVTDADVGVTTFTYDTAGQMTAIEDSRGTTFLQNRYDSNGRVIEQTLADRGTYAFDYTLDSGGRRVVSTTVTDPRGVDEQVDFDANGLPVQQTPAVGTAVEQTTRLERDATTHLVEAIVDPLGNRTELTYDNDANVTAIAELAGTADELTTRYTYGTNARLLTEEDPLGHVTRYGYDTAGRLVTITDPTSRTTTFGYVGSSRQPASIRDAGGHETQLGYVNGDLRSVTDPLGRTTTRWVDSVGRVTAISDPLGRTTRAVYDDANLLVKTIDPRGGETTYGSDANGNVTSVTDARGKTMRATYDLRDKLASWTDAEGETETLERDLNGNVVKVTDRNGDVTTYRYDGLNRSTFAGFGTTGRPGSETYDSTIDYSYDDGDRLLELDDSATGTVENAWDDLGRLTSQTTPNGEVSYTYDDASRRETLSLDGSSLAAYGYDAAGRLTSVAQGGETTRLAYDGAGRLDSVTLPNDVERTTTYDVAGQVTRLDYALGASSLGDLQYAYDAAGRRVATWGTLARFRLPDAMRSATYDDANRRTAQDSTTLAWDDNGNLTDDGTDTYSWNSRNQLIGIRDRSSTIASFTYDPLGRRAGATIDSSSRSFVYDGWNVVKEDGASTDAILVNGLGLDQVFARTIGATTSSVLADVLGSTVALADDRGTISDEFAYGPFGESDTNVDHPFQYTGRENDGTGLYQFRNRYYSPAMKRFISEDPTGMGGSGTNYYAYGNNDPLDFTDPTGLSFIGDAFSNVSQFTAGAWDGATFGYASRLFGVDPNCWTSSAHAWGRGVGAAGAGAAAGIYIGPIVGAAAGGGLLASSIAGGAISGGYTAAGVGGGLTQIAQGAVAGTPGGLAGGAVAALGKGTSAATAAAGGGAVTGFGFDTAIGIGTGTASTSGSKDSQC